MADDPQDPAPKPDEPAADPAKLDDKGDPDALGDPGKRALEAIRKERDAALAEAKAAQAKVKEFEDKDKSESERNADAKAAAEKERDEAKADALRLTVAFEKGLTPAQAKRLSGSTREELEADADELLDLFADKDGGKRPPTNRPKERLRGGADPDDEPEETDPRKIAANIPRRF